MENFFVSKTEAQAILQSNPGVDPVVFQRGTRRLQASRADLEAVVRQQLSDTGIVKVKALSEGGPNWLLIGGGLLALALLTRRRS
jgi:hypothetical protein